MGSSPSTNKGSSPPTNMGSSLPDELVQDILVRLPVDEPVHLARASLVCKAWRRVLSDRESFLRRCREFHRHRARPPPMLGYIQNSQDNISPMRFVTFFPAASMIASRVINLPAVDCSGWCALDCRHGRVLILDAKGDPSKRLIVWDPITGSHQHLSVPSAIRGPSSPSNCYAGAVLCAKDGCDHLDCHGGPFHVVLLVTNCTRRQFAIATKYSSLTSAWGAPTTCNDINQYSDNHIFPANGKHSLLIGDVLYFPYGYGGGIIIKYDLRAHWLSKIIGMPEHMYGAILMKAEGGGLGLATLKDNCIYLCSGQDDHNAILPSVVRMQWVQHQVINLRRLVPRQAPFESYKVIGFAEGTDNIFINISNGIYMLNLESKELRKVGERERDRVDPILPYMSF